VGDDVERAFSADGALEEVDPGEAPKGLEGGLAGRRRRRRGVREEVAAAGEGRAAAAGGEEPEVADADEAVGEDVEEEAAQELFGGEGQGRWPSA
jgi:hypothetical protein